MPDNKDCRNPYEPVEKDTPLFGGGNDKGGSMSKDKKPNKKDYEPNWEGKCETCDESPVVPISGLCGPCHFGNSDALTGDWWNSEKEDFNEENI